MIVCFLTPDMSLGGSSTLIFDLINNWPTNDEIHLIVFFNKIDERYLNNFKRQVNIKILNKRRTIDFKFLKELKTTILSINPDVISSHLTATFYLASLNSCKKFSVFHTIHSEPSLDLPWFYRIFLKKKIKSKKIRLIGCCDYISKQAMKVYGVECETINNGLSLTNDGKKSFDIVNFLFVGRFVSIKNVPMLIDAFNQISNLNSTLTICGYGEQEDDIIKLVNSSPRKNDINFIGKTNNIQEFYKKSNVLCLPSTREGLPITILESLNFGLAVITSNVGGNSQFVKHEYNGFLLDEINCESLVKYMEYMANNIDMVEKFCNNSLLLKKTIDIRNTVNCYYRKFIGEEDE